MPMDIGALLIQLFTGLSRAMMLFLLSAGLSLIFGVMNILNFAHAALWLLAGYITHSLYSFLTGMVGPFGLCLVPAIVATTALMFGVGWMLERFLIRRMYQRELPQQVLLTFALILIISDVIRLGWGVENRRIFLPIEPVEVMGYFVNPYLFLIIICGCLVAAGLWWFLQKTKYGRIVRAAVFSREMVSALGINIPNIYAGVFGLGIAIAAFCAGLFLGIMPIGLGVDMDLIVQCFAVVIIGGFGSILGTFVASIIVGVVYAFSIFLWPDGSLAMIFIILVGVLIWRPWGLFGTEMRF